MSWDDHNAFLADQAYKMWRLNFQRFMDRAFFGLVVLYSLLLGASFFVLGKSEMENNPTAFVALILPWLVTWIALMFCSPSIPDEKKE